MIDLADFIKARLAEEEAHARKDLHLIAAATPLEQWTQWTAGLGYNLPFSEIGAGGSIGRITSTYGRRLADGEADQHRADATLIARCVRRSAVRAERTLRDVAAKRALLALHGPVIDGTQGSWTWFAGSESASEKVCRLLALPYADHPDYQAEWSP